MKRFVLGGVGAMIAVAADPCMADTAAGYQVRYMVARDLYCVRPVTLSEAERLGIAVYKSECRSVAAWAAMGIKVSHF